jgi:5-oxopent-3-ene-1,2,5-tricarboxylate decarboxylase / 2-hydroxyhepta-2,4-diene-1,7-dioate isomerase
MSDDRRDISPLFGLTAGTIDYVLETRLGLHGYFMSGQVRPVTSATRFCGKARTLRTLPTRSDVVEAQRGGRMPNAHRQAMDEIGDGEVLVIDARGVRDAAVCGDVLASRVEALRGAAIVTDGCVRDLPGLSRLNLPIFAGGVHATLFGNRHVGIDVNLPIACGGVLVMPGDILVGDEEGVVVVPAHLEQQVADLAREQDAMDSFSLQKIREGHSLRRAFPLDAELRAEFDSSRQ